MAITGHLAEFSLAEIFQFLEQGHKSGLLMITPLAEPTAITELRSHYIWFNQGRIVAASHRPDQRGLVALISERGWVGDRALTRLAQTFAPEMPLGLFLKSQGLIQAEQLKLLFYVQVMRQVCSLFTLLDGWFQFDSSVRAPAIEMTGLNAPAVDVTLSGLRALKNWSALADKLPDPQSSLLSVVEGKPQLKLNQAEWQVWEFTNGDMSVQAIAKQLQLPVESVQQIAFRLIVVGLLEEVPMIAPPAAIASPIENDPISSADKAAETQEVSQSFLQGLMNFLIGQT